MNVICTVQVFTNMQPLNVCLSYSGTMKIIGNISSDHDIDVQMWSDELVPKPPEEVSITGYIRSIILSPSRCVMLWRD